SDDFVRNVTDVVGMGDKIRVKVLLIDDQGRVKLSRKAAIAEEGEAALALEDRHPTTTAEGGGGDRGGHGGGRGGDGGRRGGGRGPRGGGDRGGRGGERGGDRGGHRGGEGGGDGGNPQAGGYAGNASGPDAE